jgi:YHS domain-containing protein
MPGMDQSKMKGMPGMNPSGTAATGSKKSMPGMPGMNPSGTAATGSKKSMPGMPGMNPSGTGKEISQGSPQAKTKEPICFKDVDTQGAEKATYKGKTYYFCSRADREKFLSDPAAYVNR